MVKEEINTKNNIKGDITETKYLLVKSNRAMPIKLKIENGKKDLQNAIIDIGISLFSFKRLYSVIITRSECHNPK
jgi:hypothetical protein